MNIKFLKLLFFLFFFCQKLIAQNSDFQAFKTYFKPDKPDSSIQIDSLQTHFFELTAGFFKKKEQISLGSELQGKALNYFLQAEKIYLQTNSFIRNTEIFKPKAVHYYSFSNVDLFVVEVQYRLEIGGINQIGIFTNKTGEIFQVKTLSAGGFDAGSGFFHQFLVDQEQVYLLKLSISNIYSQISDQELLKNLSPCALLSGNIEVISTKDNKLSEKYFLPLYSGSYQDKTSNEIFHYFQIQTYNDTPPEFMVLYQKIPKTEYIPVKINQLNLSSNKIILSFYSDPKKYHVTTYENHILCELKGAKVQKFERIKEKF